MMVPAFLCRKIASLISTPTLSLQIPRRRQTTVVTPVDPSALLLVCTALYQHQDAPDQKLHSRLRSISFHLSHEFFLQVCNRFPFSWKPIHRFYLYTLQRQNQHSDHDGHDHQFFHHTSVSVNKVVDVLGKGRNIPLLWEFLREAAEKHLADEKTYLLAARAFAEGRQLKKCVGVFDVIAGYNTELYHLVTLNKVVEMLCDQRLVDVSKEVVMKLKPSIPPDAATYKFLVVGFCKAGDLVQATKLWNKMVEEGLEPDVDSYEEIMVTFFKTNRLGDAMKVFKSIRTGKMDDLGLSTYRAMITWMCNQRKIDPSLMILCEMVKRGVGVDGTTLGALIYGFLARRKIREGYKVLGEMCVPDISVYHGLIKGLLRLRRVGDATQVFREMSQRGCEPIMHTYIMLLQGHLGKRGRKGKDPIVNFDSIFVGGLVKAGKCLEATKYVERMMWRGTEVPRFDYNRFLHCFSNEEGVVMFEEVGKRLKEVGMVDLGDIFLRYGEKMTTRDRRRRVPQQVPTSMNLIYRL